jgi:(p)ppGpp synthase/HD superfamily hydrolase
MQMPEAASRATEGGAATRDGRMTVRSERARRTVGIQLEAPDRQGLLRDIIRVLAELDLPLLANTGRVDAARRRAIISLEVPVTGARELACLVDKLGHLEGVLEIRCDSQ